MKINHHPAPESLLSCSAGSMPEAFAAVMASHIAVCATCRHELAIMELIGTKLFDEIPPAAMSRTIPEDLPPAHQTVARHRHPSGGEIPRPLGERIGKSLDTLEWQVIGPGVWQYLIPLSHGPGSLRLLKVAPGQSLPEHGHFGSELTLVLRGSFDDNTGHYTVGDVSDVDENVEHTPVADCEHGCICLIATEGKLRFKGRLARLIQPLTGF